MRNSFSKLLSTSAALVALAIPAAAHAQTVWDLGALAGSGGGLTSPSPFVFTNGALGSITGYATNSSDWLYSKDFGSALTDSEHGIGLCVKSVVAVGCNTAASNDFEIGDFGADGMVMEVNLLGTNEITGFRLASVQAGEAWKVFYTTTGAGTCNASTSFTTFYSGTGPTGTGDFADVATNADCFKFVPNGGVEGTGKDYLLETFTTDAGGSPQSLTPEPASMTLLATGLVGLVASTGRRRRKA